jgi:hypothetical protein
VLQAPSLKVIFQRGGGAVSTTQQRKLQLGQPDTRPPALSTHPVAPRPRLLTGLPSEILTNIVKRLDIKSLAAVCQADTAIARLHFSLLAEKATQERARAQALLQKSKAENLTADEIKTILKEMAPENGEFPSWMHGMDAEHVQKEIYKNLLCYRSNGDPILGLPLKDQIDIIKIFLQAYKNCPETPERLPSDRNDRGAFCYLPIRRQLAFRLETQIRNLPNSERINIGYEYLKEKQKTTPLRYEELDLIIGNRGLEALEMAGLIRKTGKYIEGPVEIL